MTVRLKSFALKDEVTDSDRRVIERVMFEEVLEAEKFPEVVFKSSRITSSKVGENRYRFDVEGIVTLHGVRNPHCIDVQIVANNDSLRAYGEFRLRQTDYGIRLASVAGGTVRIKDEVKFVFYILARKQE